MTYTPTSADLDAIAAERPSRMYEPRRETSPIFDRLLAEWDAEARLRQAALEPEQLRGGAA